MSYQSEFPILPQSRLSRQELVDYLIEQKRRGYEVFQQPEDHNIFILSLNETQKIRFIYSDPDLCRLERIICGQNFDMGKASNITDLSAAVNQLARSAIGDSWSSGVTRMRLHDDQPATNYASIARLIGGSAIEAMFDPYLDNQSLAALIDILSFGAGSVANGVRVLSTNKTTGRAPRLTKVGFNLWLSQLEINGEIRLMGGSEHRRFLLLSNGQSLLLGPSLNALHKNEAVRLEPNIEDLAFFEKIWATAIPLE